ncbi:PspC domain-containing protein [Streptomyces benahoarensis]|uniref:PspC domain-containing protein n=1 Tax=Streptomyces benahoarensis TaxID=2595054 RepID=A0A553YQC4_9ACTN|nr:PspC domain-containing protein [Streptomyces benahoarensis]TSB31223.1 PspC domain-containing protein [Streptomyces benahoarensis]
MNEAAPAEESAPPGADGSTPPRPPLRRSRRHKVVAGVCGGLGRQWDLDPVIFRIVLAVLSITGGLGLIFYGFAWLIIPLHGEEENEGRRLLSGRVEGSALTALLFALVGCGLFLTTLGKGSVMSFAVLLTLAVAGAAYWSRRHRGGGAEGPGARDAATAQVIADAPPETMAPPGPQTPPWWRGPLGKEPAGLMYLWGPEHADLTYEGGHGVPGGPVWPPGFRPGGAAARPSGAPAPQRRRPRAGRRIGGVVFLLAALGGAGTALGVDRHASFSHALQAGLACALVVFGLGLVISAWLGRTGGGTVVMMVLTTALLAVSTVLPDNISAEWQNRHWAPTEVSAVQRHYELGSGGGRLDLGGLPVKDGHTIRTGAEVGAGRLEVTLPQGVETTVHLSLGLGDVRLPGESANDVRISADDRTRTVTLPAEGLKKGEKPRGFLDLTLRVGAGQIDVRHALPPSPAAPASPSPPGAASPPTAGSRAGALPAAAVAALAPVGSPVSATTHISAVSTPPAAPRTFALVLAARPSQGGIS